MCQNDIHERRFICTFYALYLCTDHLSFIIVIESLDQLTEWVTSKFSHVRNKSIPIPEFEGHPLTENEVKVCNNSIRREKEMGMLSYMASLQ